MIVLLVPSLLTLGLLGFSLFSDYWIKIKDVQLEQVQFKYENNFNIFNGGGVARLSGGAAEKGNGSSVVLMTTTTSTPRPVTRQRSTSTTTTSTTTTTTTVRSTTQAEYNDDGLTSDDTTYDNDEYRDKDPVNPNDYELNTQDDFKRKKLKRQVMAAVPPPPPPQTPVSFVYITKLWPFTKYKSLYSECIEYKKMHLKLSTSYLNQINKAPIIGPINYGPYLTYVKGQLMEDARGENKQCDNKIGYIKCVLNQQCVPGKK